ncbi:MAG TPA: methionine--tRNA ligase subunit beta [bacterium]
MSEPMSPDPVQKPGPEAPVPQSPVADAQIGLDAFQRVHLRIGTIVAAEAHPGADRLLVLRVDVGEGSLRQLVAGIRAQYAPETLIGRQVVVVANLKPARLRGVESQGMVLAASGETGPVLLSPDSPVPPGSIVK